MLSLAAILVVTMLLAHLFVRQTGEQLVIEKHQEVLMLQFPELSDSDYDWIAAGIYHNEARGQSRYLTFWGEGEDFPSFGIGHFIWFPTGVDAPFDEMFPRMFAFVSQHGHDRTPAPDWLSELTPFEAPWSSRESFNAALSSPKMTQMRKWLEDTAQLQARFIVSTFEKRWKNVSLSGDQKNRVTRLLQELAASAEGLFAIIDYYNFKGLGVNPHERYQGEGWGLIQVLESVWQQRQDSGRCGDLLDLFTKAAGDRLRMRVALAPPERNEERWLEGWLARLESYVANSAGPTGHINPC